MYDIHLADVSKSAAIKGLSLTHFLYELNKSWRDVDMVIVIAHFACEYQTWKLLCH